MPLLEKLRMISKRDAIDYIEAAKAIANLEVEPILKQLLEDALIEDLKIKQNLPEEAKRESTVISICNRTKVLPKLAGKWYRL